MIRPNVSSTNRRFTSKVHCLAAAYTKWDCVFNPRDNIQLLLHWPGVDSAGQGCLRAGLKALHYFVRLRQTHILYEHATVLSKKAERRHIYYRVVAGILDGELLSEWARRIK